MFETPQARLLQAERTKAEQVLLRQSIDRRWREFTWREVMRQARQIAAALGAMGLGPGDRVGLFSKNCAEWFIADFALMLGGFVSVPIYPTAQERTVRYVLEHSEARACFVGKLDSLDGLDGAFPEATRTIAMPYPTLACDERWDELLARHEPLAEVHEPALADTMTLLYTSGSTGQQKAAIHSYHNFAFVGTRFAEFFASRDDDRVLSYLPLAHCTERAYVEAAALYGRGTIHFVESLDTFFGDLVRTEPTLFGSVPRLWKRFQLGVLDRFGARRLDRLLRIPLLGGLLAARIRSGLGLGRARWVGSGTAPIAPALLTWYERLGLPIHEGWGLTESFAYGTQTPPGSKPKLGTIGKALRDAEVRIGEGQEILLKCPSLMTGYYKEPELSAQAFTEDGFLHTGDCGAIDGEGFVRITGRAKEIFKTAKGKYVAPVPIESLLAQNPLVEQACVVGLGMPQPVALIQVELSGIGNRELARDRLADTLLLVNRQLESHERLARLIVVADEWTVTNGLLTPTLKLRREAIEARYAPLIDVAAGRVAFEGEVRRSA